MFNGAIITRKDLEESAKLERRRQFEEARKKRIFDAKRRTIGIDSTSLDSQLFEHKEKQSKELEIQRRYDEEAERQSALLRNYEVKEEQRRRLLERDLNYYRCNYQRKHQRREYDLNDPHALRKSQPTRLDDDDDAKLGVSSAQIFDGEDSSFAARRHLQTEQQCAWLEQQIRERRQAELSQRQAENERAMELEERERCLQQIAESEKRMRAELRQTVNAYNMELAKEKQIERERAKREKMEDDLAEIYNMLSSDLLAEDPSVGKSCIDPTKRLPYMYRGMTPEEKWKFQNDQLQCKRAQEERRQSERTKEQAWDAYVLERDRELEVKEQELQQRQKKAYEELLAHNRQLAARQSEKLDIVNKDRNDISDEFFTQFNTTSR